MPTIKKETDIDYLIRCRLGNLEWEDRPGIDGALYAALERHNGNVRSYREELLGKSPEEVAELVRAERLKQAQAQIQKAEEEERRRLFNQPQALADWETYAFASKCAEWSLDEAIAYSLGRKPKIVRWEVVRPYTDISKFAARFEELRDLAHRAKRWEQLFDPVLPGFYLAWAKQTGIDVPSELLDAVSARGTLVANWKSAYETVLAAHEKLTAAHTTLTETTNVLRNQRDGLLTALEQERNARQQQEDTSEKHQTGAGRWPWGNHESDLLRAIEAAVKRWWARYDPAQPDTAPRNEDVAAWLVQENLAAARVAEVIAQIIRADGLRPGPRR